MAAPGVCWVCGSVMVALCDGGFAVMVALWVCLWWFAVDCGGGYALAVGLLFLIFFIFILRCFKHYKIFSDYFSKCKQILKKQSFFLKSFTFINILR
jgi:hypothetical protein